MVDGTNKKITLAASRMDELKDWTTEIRLAKKKKLGVDAATHDLDLRKVRVHGARVCVVCVCVFGLCLVTCVRSV